ncbi:uncharacterized protein LOC126272051 isoform X2 [Schistocerca gregaria]|uniref:uncharacterized protein LOC126272051 isoform X2 n=1 Tax=Schistocerca gregaria TaxID=7010 RepID=UPI00211EE9A3|nr:uncharacterized protein LOC126272051 isoform X2 [Schistocerca gregaria]
MKVFLLLLVVGVAIAEDVASVEKPVVVAAKPVEKVVDVGSRTAAVEIGGRSAVPVTTVYPYTTVPYYWPYYPYVTVAASPQVGRSDVKSVVPYYTVPYAYTYPYYTYPVVAAAPAAAATPVGASVYYGSWLK